MTDEEPAKVLTHYLTNDQVALLAFFLNHVSIETMRCYAKNEDEAVVMMDGAMRLGDALSGAIL